MQITVYSVSDYLKIRTLIDDPRDLTDIWNTVEIGPAGPADADRDLFARLVEQITEDVVVWCSHTTHQGFRLGHAACGVPLWESDASTPDHGEPVCDDCLDRHYTRCSDCGDFVQHPMWGSEDAFCEGCLDANCSFCDECDEYYRNGYGDDHQHGGCECDAPHRTFQFPANGDGTISENERLNVTLPAGTISGEGISEIVYAISSDSFIGDDRYRVNGIIRGLDPLWQKKDGNFTRRASKAIHTTLGKKMPPVLISKIGNIARAHTSDTAGHWIEFTRDLNAPPNEFCNEDSCWWQSYSASRCAFKQWGGLGMRSYHNEGTYTENAMGRVWVQPLDSALRPTHDVLGAHGYVIYNSYGTLDGYTAARIIAHLTGRTYRKVSVDLEPQYVNGNSGYLVADEATVRETKQVCFSDSEHSTRDAHTIDNERIAA